jgi:hypothetical protein
LDGAALDFLFEIDINIDMKTDTKQERIEIAEATSYRHLSPERDQGLKNKAYIQHTKAENTWL